MKRIFLILFGIAISLSACIADADKRPHINDNEVWVCENPRAEFYWSKNDDKTSTIFVGEKKYNVTFGSSAGPQFRIYDEGAKACENQRRGAVCVCCRAASDNGSMDGCHDSLSFGYEV